MTYDDQNYVKFHSVNPVLVCRLACIFLALFRSFDCELTGEIIPLIDYIKFSYYLVTQKGNVKH